MFNFSGKQFNYVKVFSNNNVYNISGIKKKECNVIAN